MILRQYYLGCLAHASYLLGDEASSTAIIIDPQRDIERYLAEAERLQLQIRHVFLSHFHADFVASTASRISPRWLAALPLGKQLNLRLPRKDSWDNSRTPPPLQGGVPPASWVRIPPPPAPSLYHPNNRD